MDKLFNKLGIKAKEVRLYETAFSHSSYSNEHKKKGDYERLEFLGDAVLDLVIADYLYNNYTGGEGEMTKVRASYVCENANYEYAMSLDLNEYIKVGHGELKEGGQYKKAIVADIFEALMGAIYLDLGYSTVRNVILKVVIPFIENESVSFFSDYKSSLQEYVQTDQRTLNYVLINESGPSHNKTFEIEARVDDIVYGKGIGTSKKEAEQEAAKNALSKLIVK